MGLLAIFLTYLTKAMFSTDYAKKIFPRVNLFRQPGNKAEKEETYDILLDIIQR